MEHVACALCGADRPLRLARIRNDQYLRALNITPDVSFKVMCAECGHVYADPQLDRDEVSRLYAEMNRSSALGYTADALTPEYLARKARKAREDREWLRRHVPSLPVGDVLEIGCAEGTLLSNLQREGWRAIGVEMTPACVVHARSRGVQIHDAFFEQIDFGARRFALIICLAVIEHMKDPCRVVAKIRSLLADGGYVYVSVPSALLPGGNPNNRFASPHLSLFTPATLTRLFATHGLRMLHLDDGPDHLYAVATHGDAPVLTPTAGEVERSRRETRRVLGRARRRAFVRRIPMVPRTAAQRVLVGLFGAHRIDRMRDLFRSRA